MRRNEIESKNISKQIIKAVQMLFTGILSIILVLGLLPHAALAKVATPQAEVIIDYVDTDTKTALYPSFHKLVGSNEEWMKDSPEIIGYELANATQRTITATGGAHITVDYHKKTVPYRVIHMKQIENGGYQEADVDEFNAVVDSVVTTQPRTYTGFHLITADKNLTISRDGKAIKTLYYDRDNKTVSLYFQTGGNPIPTLTGKPGTYLSEDALRVNAQRNGYIFKGWDTNGDNKVDQVPSLYPGPDGTIDMEDARNFEQLLPHEITPEDDVLFKFPNQDMTFVAIWSPSDNTPYIVRTWQECNKNDTNAVQASDGRWYAPKQTISKYGTTNTPTTAYKQNAAPFGFEYAFETNPAIASDGSTVQDVYYKSRDVQVRYYVQKPGTSLWEINGAPFATHTVKYHTGKDTAFPTKSETLAAWIQNGGNPSWKQGEWHSVKSRTSTHRPVISPRFIIEEDGSLICNYVAPFSADFYLYYAAAVLQNIDGSYPSPQMNSYNIMASENDLHGFYQPSDIDVENIGYRWGYWDGINDPVWENEDFKPGNMLMDDGSNYIELWGTTAYNGKIRNIAQARGKRRSHPATYYSNGAEVAKKTHLFEAHFNTLADCDPSTLMPPAPGWEFVGWYNNEKFEGNPITDTKMPTGKTTATFYAKWIPPVVTISFDSHGGKPVDTQQFRAGDKATAPTVEREGGYRFLGWFYQGTSGTYGMWNFDQPISENMTLHALWSFSEPNVAYTVVHVNQDGKVLFSESVKNHPRSDTATAHALAKNASERQGYKYVDAEAKSLQLEEDENRNIITFVYSNDPMYTYTIHYQDTEGNTIAKDNVVSSSNLLFNAQAQELDGWKLQGTNTAQLIADTPEYTFVYSKITTSKPPQHNTKEVVKKTKLISKANAMQDVLPKTGDTTSSLYISLGATGIMIFIATLCTKRIKSKRN